MYPYAVPFKIAWSTSFRWPQFVPGSGKGQNPALIPLDHRAEFMWERGGSPIKTNCDSGGRRSCSRLVRDLFSVFHGCLERFALVVAIQLDALAESASSRIRCAGTCPDRTAPDFSAYGRPCAPAGPKGPPAPYPCRGGWPVSAARPEPVCSP